MCAVYIRGYIFTFLQIYSPFYTFIFRSMAFVHIYAFFSSMALLRFSPLPSLLYMWPYIRVRHINTAPCMFWYLRFATTLFFMTHSPSYCYTWWLGSNINIRCRGAISLHFKVFCIYLYYVLHGSPGVQLLELVYGYQRAGLQFWTQTKFCEKRQIDLSST
jgi:hypothetical protein